MTACQMYADPKGNESHLPFEKVKTAFNASYMLPIPSDKELKQLFRALEAYYNEDMQIVNWSKILDAITHREQHSMRGIFPRIIIKVGTAEKTGLSEKEIEAQKELQKMQEERIAREEAKEKALAQLKKADLQASKSLSTQKTKELSKNDLKKQERELALQKEEERLMKVEQDKIEKEAVKKEAEEFSKRLNAIIAKFRAAGNQQQIVNTFRLFDKDGNGKLNLKEFTIGMLQSKIHCNPDEVQYVYSCLDTDNDEQISYKEFCDVIWGNKKVDVIAFIAKRRHALGLDTGIDPKIQKQLAQVSLNPLVDDEYRSVGSVSGLSALMKRSEDEKPVNKFVDSTEPARNFQEIKSIFQTKFFTFEELLQVMFQDSKPSLQIKVTLKDLEKAVIHCCGRNKFSTFQLKSVFSNYAQGVKDGIEKAYIPIRDFKELFYPSQLWKTDFLQGSSTQGLVNKQKTQKPVDDNEDNQSVASMLLDDIMQGKAVDDILKERQALERKQLVEEEMQRQKSSIKDDFETQSNFSERIEQIIAVKSSDPRSMKNQTQQPNSKNVAPNQKSDPKAWIPKGTNPFGNVDLYRQTEVKNKQKYLDSTQFDHAVDKILVKFVTNLLNDLHVSAGKQQPNYGSYVDRYGKEVPGFVTFNEVKEMYMTHVHYADISNARSGAKETGKILQTTQDDNLLRALYNTISPEQRNKISREDFAKFLESKEPPSFLQRLQVKIKRGQDRLVMALREECQDADVVFGANSLLPLPVFQTIMKDYDLPIISSDVDDLRKRGFVQQDSQQNNFVCYKDVLNFVAPVQITSTKSVINAVVLIQKVWRGRLARKQVERMRSESESVQELKDQVQALQGKKQLPTKKEEITKKGKLSKEDLEKKKQQVAKQQRQGRKDAITLEKKIAQVVKPVRDSKAAERAAQQKQEITDYIKQNIIEHIITKAYCYGESLEVCRNIQQKYENRPVTKYIYPLLQQFQFSSQGVSSKSLQPFNALGQVMYLNAQNQLNQYDVATNKTLQPVSLGTRPPLKHYNIIDMVVDQRSGRIYTINSNWILEIWNIEQNASFPQKRIAVCTNEGGKDFISLYYENTFNDAKPRFLCLQESNQQVLVVNTSCVDGSIVFIDPISFSILKKIQLRYSDYELPLKTRNSIKKLTEVFDIIKQRQGKDIVAIFSSLVNKDTQEVAIKDLVAKLCELDKNLKRDDLFQIVIALDEDNSGKISLDEFLNFFGQVDDNDDYHQAQEEQLLQDEMWPKWVLDQGKLPFAQTILLAMYNSLEKNHGITPEAAFGIYDMSDSGFCSQAEFRRIVKIFFGEIAPEGEKLDFLIKLTVAGGDTKIRYREFCKFLGKRFVKTFKLATKQQDNKEDEDAGRQKTALEQELDRPTQKEASLSYILRKAAELQIDLRREFLSHDLLELSVISRVNFQGILLSLPLGLNEDDLEEVFDNDLNFDNNGNVDYVVILNSDIFVALERKRLTTKALLKSASFKQKETKQSETEITDNRKVVVEDLIFIDDLEIIIYTTVRPKSSTIFVTSMCKSQKSVEPTSQGTKVIELSNLNEDIINDASVAPAAQIVSTELTQTTYPLIAKLRGHKNDGAPSICYITHSNCLISAEKHVIGNNMPQDLSKVPKHEDPSVPISHKVKTQSLSGYTQFTDRHEKANLKCEILIWNLQRDMIELFSTNYPWNVQAHKKWAAHDASIIDICYLAKSQLIVTAGMDQTIRFWDPVQMSFELTDPSNNPHAQMKPGYYKPLQAEQTRSNQSFKEVKRIYCGNDTNCFALRTLNIANVILNPAQPAVKSQIEWLICLKNPIENQFNKNKQAKNRVGIICGYGIERVRIEIPAKNLDDIVPPYVMKECEELIEQRRRKIVTAFQKQLPVTIEKIYSQTQLQNSYMDKIRGLFMQAILNRKDGQFVNPVPLREIYNVILKLPARTKFESFLASNGCSDKLSVSETFFYLQKFMQIHPLRTTQIEFEKSIEDFYNKHQREFLKGVKRWPKQSIQKLANYIRNEGLDINFLQEQSAKQMTTASFCTRERFIEYFITIKPVVDFADDEIDNILQELDPYQTGAIQLNLLQKYFREEIEQNRQVNLKRPQEIIDKIRAIAFPNRKIALQQSLAAADEAGDGYINKVQFVEAIYRAEIKIERDSLELLFDVMAERFDTPKPDDMQAEVKHLNLPYFFSKLFTKSEVQAVTEVDQTLQHIKTALIYKGVDFGIVFAEIVADEAGSKTKDKAARKVKDSKIDLMCHYSRFAQQIVKQEFCERVAQLNAVSVTPDKIMRLANYLSLNQKNQSVIYLNAWMHHLRRINTQFQVPDHSVLPVICSKLLKNESIFRSYIDSMGLLKSKREADKFVEQADLRQVLKKFGISYINQGLFLQEFTKGSSVHVTDLIARMKACLQQNYQGTIADLNDKSGTQVQSLQDLKKTDYFESVQKAIKQSKMTINTQQLIGKMQEFDDSDTGLIQAYKLVNIIKYQLPGLLDEQTLIGLQYELECLSYEHLVDYSEFVKIFLQPGDGKKINAVGEIKLDLKRSAYTLGEYEELLGRMSEHIKNQGLNLIHIFEIFCKKQGFISYQDLRKIIALIDFPITDKQFDLLTMYADESGQQNVHAYDLAQQIENAETVAPQFDIQKWIIASRELQGRHNLLVLVYDQLQLLKDSIIREFSEGKANYEPSVLTGLQFSSILRKEIPSMSERDIDLLTVYSIKGSRRAPQNGEVTNPPISIYSDLVQFQHFEKALNEVVNDMRKEEIARKQKEQAQLLQELPQHELDRELQKITQVKETVNPETLKRESQLINKVTQLFREREVSFFDCFQQHFDPLTDKNIIQIKEFKELVGKLNLPLTVQDQRILRRIADPQGIGKVDLKQFCYRFETQDLRTIRLNQTLDKVATAFYVQNFNLKKAFQLFDVNGDGKISKQELRQGFASLEIGIKYDEISDLMRLIQPKPDGSIGYDEFIQKIDANIRHRRSSLQHLVEDQVFTKIANCISYAGESLFDAMKIYDTQDQNQIQSRDLTRVFKRLGLQSIEPHMPLVLQTGGVRMHDEIVEIRDFCDKFMSELNRRTKQSSMIRVQTINKLHSVLVSQKISMFDFFNQLDTNRSGKISKLELMTGIQCMNLILNREEFEMLWSLLYKPNPKVNLQPKDKRLKKDVLRPIEPEISYYDLILGFIASGTIKFNRSTDRADILIAKFRQQLKRLNYTVEKLYKAYDPKDVRYVFKNDFIDTSMLLGIEFAEEELVKIFETFCRQGEKDQSKITRFSFKQMHDTLLVQKDINWIFNAYIKIHSLVVQKGLTYKRLFSQWKTGKAPAGRLTASEISSGLKKLKAGLTQDEIDKLVAQLKYEGKELTISDRDFEQTVISGAQKLEQEQSFERMLLAQWIALFNEQMERNLSPIDNLFQEYDSGQEGNMVFDDFCKMNASSGVNMNRKELHRIFDLIDRHKNGKVRLEELKLLSQFVLKEKEEPEQTKDGEELNGTDILTRQKTNDLYEELKVRIETKNITLEHVIFNDLKFEPMALATTQGVKQILEKLQIILTQTEAQQILNDVRAHNYGKFECSYKSFIDFMTKKRINVVFVEKGFIDPLLASTVQAFNRVKDLYDFTYDQLFAILDAQSQGFFSQEQFLICTQGMNLGCAVEDIIELFNYMDDQSINRVTKAQFVTAMTFINQKMGGPSMLEQSMNKGLGQAKKGFTNMQQVFQVLKQICEGIQRKRLQIKQLNQAMDINKTGYLSRAEFTLVIQNIAKDVKLEDLRIVMQFLDDKSTGKIAIFEFLRIVLEILNQQIGGGVYAFLQTQPIIQKVINELSIDCDRFFDEVADLNEVWMQQQKKESFQQVGLMKSIFIQTLNKYGVTLSEKENALISSVFGLGKQERDKLDYTKLDAAFEGVQQQLYAQESQYTVEWERRVFKKIGDYLMRLNISIHECFQMIDTDDSQTISIQELSNALVRFDLGLSNKQTKAFLARVDSQSLGYITQQEFIQRFWSAYTYDDVFGDETQQENTLTSIQMPATHQMSSHNIQAANRKMKSELDQKVHLFRMFKSVQKRLIETMDVQKAFVTLDTNQVGFLTLRDLQINLSKHFNLSLKANEVRALFQEIDGDENGIIKFQELDIFYLCDYREKVKGVQKERQDRFMQNEIFDHLIKVLKQRGLTLQQVFEEIDDDKNNYIEVDEFHDMLERMGFTINQEQVFELMKTMDQNFDGRISYNELKQHFNSLGFNLDQIEGEVQTKQVVKITEHRWRDKGLELIIRTIKQRLEDQSIQTYLAKYDGDHDEHLTPSEFRKALQDLKEPMLKQTQIERILHVAIEDRKLQPLASIPRIVKLLTNYKYIQLNDGTSGNTAVLIDEDLFVYIVEKYDGLSRMMEFVGSIEDKATYLHRHTYELSMRGLNMMSNQKQVQQLVKKSNTLQDLFQSTLVLIAGDITRLMKEEAVLTVLDPTMNINNIVTEEKAACLSAVNLPTIENSQFDVDYQSLTILPCGAQKYDGVLVSSKEKIEILLYASENLQYVSLDGKTYKRHLAQELQIHRYLMGARFEDDEVEVFNDLELDIFANVGKFEKKIGLSVNDKEIYVVNKCINDDEWIQLDEFVNKNGGILNIPLFYHTDAPLYIIRHWSKLILKIIAKVHDVSVVLRCLSTQQLWISRDGQRIRLGHVRGSGRVNNLGFLKSCPDIYLNLDNNDRNSKDDAKSTFSPSKGGGLQSSRKTERDNTQRMFSNKALDSPFLAPETLFTKFSDHSAALDVWAFGMIMFCLIFGRKPVSYYQVYRQWLLKTHKIDADMGQLPFTPPSSANFIYDPFSIDFENPFQNVNMEDLAQSQFKQKMTLEQVESQFKAKDGQLNFDNFMKCISDLSYSGMFTQENSKKFSFNKIVEQNSTKKAEEETIRFAGQQNKLQKVRNDFLKLMAKASVLERKNELGLILDLISACLDVDPKKRPTIQGLLHSPIFQLDVQERTNAVRFSQNVILYRSPKSSVCNAITQPLRAICAEALKSPMGVFDHTDTILKLFVRVEDAVAFNTSLLIDELNEVMTETEKRKGITQHMQSRGVDASKLRVSPNSPLAAQIIEDKVIDMLLFVTFRYMKNFQVWKAKQIQEMEVRIQMAQNQEDVKQGSAQGQSNSKTNKSKASSQIASKTDQVKQNMQRLENQVLVKMTHLLKTIVYQMHSYNTPMAPFVADVISFVVKFFIGEEHAFGSDTVLNKTCVGQQQQLKSFLRERSFFRRECEFDSSFKSDIADKLWHLEQKNKTLFDKSNYWCPELYTEALKIYRDAITESGRGQSCYPVICDYIASVTNNFEPTKIFSKQMSHLSMSFVIPMNRTSAYYNELIPIAESLSRLYNPDLEKAGKRCSLAMVRSVFQTGNSDKIKACLDMRVPKHLVHFIQDSDQEVRKECLYTYLEISKGLQDDDFEVIGKHAANLKREFSKQGYTKTAFDLHKAVSMASQSEVLDAQAKVDKINATKRGTQARQVAQAEPSQTEAQCNYIKRTIALIEKNENEKYINFALDLPNLNFLASKRFLKEMAVCFESPVFIAPLVRLLKTPTELYPNKVIILDIFKNLVCGNERVLIAFNSPACDSYMTLLKILTTNTKMANARQNPTSSGTSTQMKQTLALQDKTVELFQYMFEQRRPTIIRDISCIGASSTLLKEQELSIPMFISLPDIMSFFDDFAAHQTIKPKMINVQDFIEQIKDLRCWVKHFYAVSTIPELTRVKAMQRCMNLLIRVLKVLWREYYRQDTSQQFALVKLDYMLLMRTSLSFFDWLCINDKFQFLFNEESGKTNLAFIVNACNMVLCQFRKPLTNTIDGFETSMPPMEDLTFNDRVNKKVQNTDERRYDIFPFTDIGSILQNIQYQLVRKNDPFLNCLLAEANFGFIFGEQLLLEYDFIRHCIDNCVESLVLMDSYVKKNEIRLNTFEYILRSSEDTIKDQLIKSNFCERIFLEYVRDFREFNIQFSKIDLEFLAFRRSYPLRLEVISMINTALMLREKAPQIYTEFLMYSRRHLLIRQELAMLSTCMAVNSKEATCLLLFAILLESNESDLIYVMVQEGAHRVIRTLMQEQPSLNKRFPILREFINKF